MCDFRRLRVPGGAHPPHNQLPKPQPQELEARGARVICLYSGGLDFSGPVRDFFTKGSVAPDAVRLTTPNPEII